jgi:hypothetical protein
LPNSTLGNTQHIVAQQTNYLLAGGVQSIAKVPAAAQSPYNETSEVDFDRIAEAAAQCR